VRPPPATQQPAVSILTPRVISQRADLQRCREFSRRVICIPSRVRVIFPARWLAHSYATVQVEADLPVTAWPHAGSVVVAGWLHRRLSPARSGRSGYVATLDSQTPQTVGEP